MRLSPESRRNIRTTAQEVFGPGATVLLFGLRIDDQARGGDIDLLVELGEHDADRRAKGLRFEALLLMRLGDQPIDVLVSDRDTLPQPIFQQARLTGVRL